MFNLYVGGRRDVLPQNMTNKLVIFYSLQLCGKKSFKQAEVFKREYIFKMFLSKTIFVNYDHWNFQINMYLTYDEYLQKERSREMKEDLYCIYIYVKKYILMKNLNSF